MKYFIVIFAATLILLDNISAEYEASNIEYTYSNCPDYTLVTSMAAYRDSVEAMYYISRYDRLEWPSKTVTLDSIRAIYADATDTNTFIFICADGQFNHLVVVKTSPTVQFDTIMTQGIDPPDNWLLYPEFATISPNFGIVVGNFGHGFSSGTYEIRQMNKDGTTSLLHTIHNAVEMGTSLDRNELYFTIQDRIGLPYSFIKVYDAAEDSFYVLDDQTFALNTPLRSTKSAPLYYVKELRYNRELWRMMPDGSHELARAFNRWENFKSINDSMDSLVVIVSRRVYSDSTYTLIFRH